ncbi:hypothetical protein V6N00_12645 [Tersicoccus sp. MR15.9]|uniref:hypothetical protein n=1 Tax=Tersicoccus mangrovi TaxID=3121635 RepID=UPI002FE66B6B
MLFTVTRETTGYRLVGHRCDGTTEEITDGFATLDRLAAHLVHLHETSLDWKPISRPDAERLVRYGLTGYLRLVDGYLEATALATA